MQFFRKDFNEIHFHWASQHAQGSISHQWVSKRIIFWVSVINFNLSKLLKWVSLAALLRWQDFLQVGTFRTVCLLQNIRACLVNVAAHLCLTTDFVLNLIKEMGLHLYALLSVGWAAFLNTTPRGWKHQVNIFRKATLMAFCYKSNCVILTRKYQ